MEDKKGHLLISHAAADAAVADELVVGLAAAGLTGFFDRRELPRGQSLGAAMNDSLAADSYLLLLVSPAFIAAHLMDLSGQWTAALAQRGIVIVPIKVAECELPELLRSLPVIDMSRRRTAGLAELLGFLGNEQRRAFTPATTRGAKLFLREASRREIRLVANHCMDESTFLAFLLDADVSPNAISGNSLGERLVNLLHRMIKEGLIEHFAEWLEHERRRCVKVALERVRAEVQWSIPAV